MQKQEFQQKLSSFTFIAFFCIIKLGETDLCEQNVIILYMGGGKTVVCLSFLSFLFLLFSCVNEIDSEKPTLIPDEYTIKFDSNGGNGTMEAVTAAVGDIVQLKTNTFSRSGYMFVNWNTAKNGHADAYDDASSVILSKDITLYAQWAEPLTVTFHANGGSGDDVSQTVPKRISTTLINPNFEQSGYVLSSWNTAADGSGTAYSATSAATFSKNTELYAQWAIPRTIYFMPNGAYSAMYTQVVADGADSVLSANSFKKEGYLFKNWNTLVAGGGTAYADGAPINITDDLTLYAQWTRLFTVKFMPNGGEGEEFLQTFYEAETTSLTKNAYTKEGYGFANWNTEPDGSGTFYTDEEAVSLTEHLTLYAQWGKVRTILFSANAQDATGEMDELTAPEGSALRLLPNGFALSGYVFVGWNTESDGSGTSYADSSIITVTGDLTLYAQWIDETVASCAVNIASSEHGFVTASAAKALPGSIITLTVEPAADYELDSITAVDETGTAVELTELESGKTYTLTTGERDITVSVTFKETIYTVNFAANHDNAEGETESLTGTTGTSVELPFCGFTAEGYTVTGWNTEPDGSGTAYAFGDTVTITQNITLYAQWLEGYGTTLEDLTETLAELSEKGITTAKIVIFDATDESLVGSAYNTSTVSKAISEVSSINIDLVLMQNDALTKIGQYAFKDLTNLTGITIPAGITKVDTDAFTGCTALSSMNFTGTFAEWCMIDFASFTANPTYFTKHLFIQGEEITGSVHIPEEATKIGTNTFVNCTAFTELVALENVSSIGSGAFWGCSNIEAMTLPFVQTRFCTFFGKDSYSGAYSCVSPKAYYGDGYTYYLPTKLTSITILGGYVARAAFYGLKIQDLTLGNNVSYIENYAFANTALTNINFGSSVSKIWNGAFKDCASLTSLTIPANITSFYENAFNGCTSLTEVNYLGTLAKWSDTYFGSETANPTYYSKKLLINGTELKGKITISTSNSAGWVWAYTYCNLESVTEITTDSSVKEISTKTFYGLSGLTKLTLSSNITTILQYAIYKCTALTSITIPFVGESRSSSSSSGETKTKFNYIFEGLPDSLTSVTVLGGTVYKEAFYNCNKLTSVTLNPSVEISAESQFRGCSSLNTLVIPNFKSDWSGIGGYFGTSSYSDSYAAQTGTSKETYYIPNSLAIVRVQASGTSSIYEKAFAGCSKIKTLLLDSGTTKIYKNAFLNCTGLTSITVPDTVKTIESGAFSGCSSLKSIQLPFVGGSATATESSAQTLFGYIFGSDTYAGGTSTYQKYSDDEDVSYCIPDSLTTVTLTGGTIFYGAFYGCQKISSVNLGSEISLIYPKAFFNCGKSEGNLAQIEFANDIAKHWYYGTSPTKGDRTAYISNIKTTLKELLATPKTASVLLRGGSTSTDVKPNDLSTYYVFKK